MRPPLQDTYVDPRTGETVYGAKAIAEGRVRSVPNAERLEMLLAQSRQHRAENPNRDGWRVVNLACEWIDAVRTAAVYMELASGRFIEAPRAVELLGGFVPVGAGWAP